jgi:hypothetical protein
VFDQDPRAVVEGAAIVYTDAWTSMGQEAEAEERRDAFAPYQVNRDLLAVAPDAVVMHCLPAHRGEEITNDVMDGPRSRIFEQSENRLHAQKALLVELHRRRRLSMERRMSGEALYERYKDALKRGHVASLRGRLEEALTAYAEAAAIAPERSTPHTSAATALMRRKRPADALRHYAPRIALSPRDEAAMLGRARRSPRWTGGPRRPTLRRLAELRASSGKLADAVTPRGAALELAEGRERRRTLEQLIERLRATVTGEPGRWRSSARCGSSTARRSRPRPHGRRGRSRGPARHAADDERRWPPAAATRALRPSAERTTAACRGTERPAQPRARDRAGAAEAEPIRAALDRDLPDDPRCRGPQPARGGRDRRRSRRTRRCRWCSTWPPRTAGTAASTPRWTPATSPLSLDPDDIALHLGLVELYEERGWTVLATEKLDLLDRLVALDDGTGADRVAAARAARG